MAQTKLAILSEYQVEQEKRTARIRLTRIRYYLSRLRNRDSETNGSELALLRVSDDILEE